MLVCRESQAGITGAIPEGFPAASPTASRSFPGVSQSLLDRLFGMRLSHAAAESITKGPEPGAKSLGMVQDRHLVSGHLF